MILKHKSYFLVLMIVSTHLVAGPELPYTTRMQNFLAGCSRRVEVVNRDADGLTYGFFSGIANCAAIHVTKNHRLLQKSIGFFGPLILVSYWVASRNQDNKELSWELKKMQEEFRFKEPTEAM